MSNLFSYAAIFQQELDRQTTAAATSGWMESNAGQVIYNGGKTIKIPVIDMDGLGDYDRKNGFADGSVTLIFKELEMSMDRGRTFFIDSQDVDETNFTVTVGNVMGEFQRTKVIPEVDAYRYSKIACIAEDNGYYTDGYTPDESSILKQLTRDIYAVWDRIGDQCELVISMSNKAAQILDNSESIRKRLDVSQFKKGEISLQVKTIDGCPIIKVPSARMKTKYVFMTGGADQETGGFNPSPNAKNINWIITERRTPLAVSKTDKIRIFNPDTNQKADAWKIDYRKYHDLWITHNKVAGVFVNMQ